MCPPSVTIATSQISPHDLFYDVRYMDRFESGNLSGVFPVGLLDLFNEQRERECPFIGGDGNEEGGEAILVHSINKEEMLMLPEGFRERFASWIHLEQLLLSQKLWLKTQTLYQ